MLVNRDSVVAPKLSESAVMLSSICSARVSAHTVRHPVIPSSSTGGT